MSARHHALIACAGSGARAGAGLPKQYRMLAGKAVVRHTLEAFAALGARLASLHVVLSPGDESFEQHSANLPLRVAAHRVGGATRAQSVLHGLQAMQAVVPVDEADWVLVHDAARCLVTTAQISALMQACVEDEIGGLLAQPLADTLKAAEGGRAARTVARNGLWLAQTPQMFRYGALVAALAQAGDAVTDEAGAMEAAGHRPLLVAGSAQNFKLTYAEDFAMAEAVLRSRAHD